MRALNLLGMVSFGKPKDWDDERDGKCNALPVLRTGSVCLSVWEFTPEERRRIAAGENLTLSCVGGQPPVLLTVAPIYDPELEPGLSHRLMAEQKPSRFSRFANWLKGRQVSHEMCPR